VNGEAVQMWILRPGDLISLGRTLLLSGADEEIARRLAALRGVDMSAGVTLDAEDVEEVASSVSLDFELNWTDDPRDRTTLHTLLPPELPGGLSPGQNAELSELLQYLHLRIRRVIDAAQASAEAGGATIPERRWQDLLDMEARLAGYLRSIGEPE
jgi:hypothetical protein